jgi:3-hydroxy-9,10-secoandrosta-1,3,5(10)-triene-9,17-dione monooxygenase reductase component
MTCQSFFSLSLAPPLIAFAPSTSSKTYTAIRRARRFCVNVLADDQCWLSSRFASSSANRFEGVEWELSPEGSPILPGIAAWVDCTHEQEFLTGDHYLVVGRVSALNASSRRPLLYFQGEYASVGGHPLESDVSQLEVERS